MKKSQKQYSRNNQSRFAQIILTREMTGFDFSLKRTMDLIRKKGIKKIRFIYPFKSNLSLVEAVPYLEKNKKYAREKGMEVLSDRRLKKNPYLPDKSFLDTKKTKLDLDFHKFNDKPKFSIIIPTHNRKDNLRFVLNNFFNQDYLKSKYEIIVVDDGSKDGTREMIKKIKPTCNFKYFYWPRTKVDQKNKWAKFYNRAGISRNIGINNSQGEIVLFNDSDILVRRDCLKRHEKYHNKYRNIVVRGFRNFLPEDFRPSLNKIGDFNLLKKISGPEKTERGIRLHCRMHDLSREGWQRIITANLSVRKRYLEEIGMFDKNFSFWGSEDIDLGYRLSELKMKFIWDSKIKIYHLWHPSWSDIDRLTLLWLGDNLLYRKYLDKRILYLHSRDAILRHLDKLISN